MVVKFILFLLKGYKRFIFLMMIINYKAAHGFSHFYMGKLLSDLALQKFSLFLFMKYGFSIMLPMLIQISITLFLSYMVPARDTQVKLFLLDLTNYAPDKISNYPEQTIANMNIVIEKSKSITEKIPEICIGFVYTIFMLIVFSKINLIICVVAISYMLIGFFINKIGYELIKVKAKDYVTKNTNSLSLLQNIVLNNQIFKSFNVFSYKFNKFHQIQKNAQKAYVSLEIRNFFISILNEINWGFLQSLLFSAIIFKLFFMKKIGLDMVIFIIRQNHSVVVMFYKLVNDIRDILKNLTQLTGALNALDLKQIEKPSGDKKLDNLKGILEIKNLTFQYNENVLLKNINIIIEPGDKLCIVGVSGSGKSTLLRLLSRQIEPPKNSIFLDGEDITNLNLDWYKEKIGFVFQSNIFFKDTVRNNILLGRKIDEDQFLKYAKELQVNEFIEDKPNGYDEIIENQNFSGGQMQRLSILRAVVGNPEIICGDELSSALDTETEAAIFNNLFDFAKNKTIIIITHNKQLLSRFTKILKL